MSETQFRWWKAHHLYDKTREENPTWPRWQNLSQKVKDAWEALVPQEPKHGLYRVYWKSGGTSLAAIGVTYDGGRWLAPINWTKPSIVFTEWDRIDKLERVVEGYE